MFAFCMPPLGIMVLRALQKPRFEDLVSMIFVFSVPLIVLIIYNIIFSDNSKVD